MQVCFVESGRSYQIYEIKSLQLHSILNNVYENISELKNTELERSKLRLKEKKKIKDPQSHGKKKIRQ